LGEQLGIGFFVIEDLCFEGDFFSVFLDAFADVLLRDIAVDGFDVLDGVVSTSVMKL
jgi:hypothetical protein